MHFMSRGPFLKESTPKAPRSMLMAPHYTGATNDFFRPSTISRFQAATSPGTGLARQAETTIKPREIPTIESCGLVQTGRPLCRYTSDVRMELTMMCSSREPRKCCYPKCRFNRAAYSACAKFFRVARFCRRFRSQAQDRCGGRSTFHRHTPEAHILPRIWQFALPAVHLLSQRP